MSDKAAEKSRGTILIADSDVVEGFLRTLLESCGYRVVLAPEGDIGSIARQDPAPDLIITNRPEPLLHLRIPIIYIASLPNAALGALCAGVLRKPFYAADMRETVGRILGAASERLPPAREEQPKVRKAGSA